MIHYIGRLGEVKYWECTGCGMKWSMVKPELCTRCEFRWWLFGNVVAAVASWFGFRKRKECGCEIRQEQLNALSQKWYHCLNSCANRMRICVGNLLGRFRSQCDLSDNDRTCVAEVQGGRNVDSPECNGRALP